MPKLTSSFVESLPPAQEKQQILRDSELTGFGLRVSKNTMTYIAECRVNGRPRRVTIGRADLLTAEDARNEARQLLAQMTRGKDPAEEKKRLAAQEVTLWEVLLKYLETRPLRARTYKAYVNVTKQRLADWLSLPITAITRQMVEDRHRFISEHGGKWKASKLQANMALRILKMLLNFAAIEYQTKEGLPLLPVNPVSTLSQKRAWHPEKQRQEILQDHQLPGFYRAVLAMRNETVRDYLLLVLFTGLRRNEAMSLKWTDMDLQARMLTVPASKSKNHKEHRLPLSTFLYDLLWRRKQASKSKFVFPGKHGHLVQISYVTEVLQRQSGIKFRVHDLRRSFLTLAERLDIPHYALKRLANHAGGTDVTFGYLIVDAERLREPMEKISQKFLELMAAGENAMTLQEALDKYINEHKLAARTVRAYRQLIEGRLADWQDLPISRISKEMMEQRYLAMRTSTARWTASKSQADLCMRVLRFVLQDAGISAPRIINQAKKVKSNRFVSDKQLPLWFEAVMKQRSTTARDFLLFLLLSGLKRSEAKNLTWQHVELDEGLILLNDRRVRLCSFLHKLVQTRKDVSKSDYLFPGRQAGIEKIDHAKEQIKQHCGFDFNAHDLRRTHDRVARRLGLTAGSADKEEHISTRLLELCGCILSH